MHRPLDILYMDTIATDTYTLNKLSFYRALSRLALATLLVGNMTLSADLGSRLSDAASIVVPGDPAFTNLTSRWREWHAPEVVAVVKAATEGDVQQAVSSS